MPRFAAGQVLHYSSAGVRQREPVLVLAAMGPRFVCTHAATHGRPRGAPTNVAHGRGLQSVPSDSRRWFHAAAISRAPSVHSAPSSCACLHGDLRWARTRGPGAGYIVYDVFGAQ